VQAASGRQYVLRSVDKEAGRVWSPELRNTFANSITQDQISLLHPYAALVAAELAEAVGVYHSNPKLVFVPDDPLLGPFRERMANRIVLFEERPDEDLGDLDSFGNTRNAVGYRTMFRKLDADNDVQVDQLAFARARLLDILISDWDRHQDQWRWAEFEVEDGGTLYRPIPRDRDVAFMSIDGLITRVAQLVSLRTWQDFDYDYGFLRGLTRNGMVQDRRLTSEVSVESWVELAHEIVASLPDATIDSAFAVLPDPIHNLDAAKLSDILRHRRDILPDIANQFALTLARDVDVVGSNKHEEFVVERTGSNSTHVMVFKIKKDGARKKLLYERTFFAEQTREIFLWGLGGEDRFSISGEASAAIKITVIGGTGHDLFSNTSRIAGRSKSTRYFDTPNNTIEPGTETKLKLNSSPSINRYNPHSYRLNGIKPVAFFGSNKDDGFFLGGGFTRTIHGFRKSPFKSRHTFVANIAAKTGAFNIKYSGAYRSVVARTDIEPQLGVFTPNNIRNFYGLGNDSQNDSTNASFYQARLSKVEAAVPVKYNFTDHAIASITPLFDYTDVRRDTTRFIAVPQPGLNPNTFDDQWYAGVGAGLSVSAIDNATNPRNGFRWSSDIKSRFGIRNASSSYTTIQSDLRVYFPLSYSPQVTMATRVGVRHIAGSFPFYSSSTLGGADNLRGFRGTRFAGRTAAYYNTELRLELFKFASFLSFGTVGVSAFSDGGRVWTDVESSDSWHRGHGGAIWAYLFDTTLIRVSYARSIEEGAVTLGLGFQY
ncbi:MAG: BamA/TamA family outer membrane protein, partial [Rhodothermales bacterium]|nr:BamA/TamA family outer membrane protein [Rhodothermales bacterium]